MSNYTRNSADVARILMSNPDGTYNLNGDRIIETEGFEVGGYDPDMPKHGPDTEVPATVDALAERIFHLRREDEQRRPHGLPSYRLGKWTDDGVIHFDVTRYFEPEYPTLARKAGELLNQICIWDWAAMDTIPCNDEE